MPKPIVKQKGITMTCTKNENGRRTAARSLVYRWFYRSLHYPSEGSGLPIIENDVSSAFEILDQPALKDKFARFIRSLDGADVEALQVEYVRLFDYRPSCPPYESAYRKDMKGAGLLGDLAEIYREGDLKCVPSLAIDHISVQFEFMHYLTHTEQSAGLGAQNYREMQKRFLEDHLMKWVPTFCDDLKVRSIPPYSILAEIIAKGTKAALRVGRFNAGLKPTRSLV